MPLRAPARRIALCLGLTVMLAAHSGHAADMGNGSKNFRTPVTVPNYFSNEAGPLLGPAAETRRGPLYSSAAPAAPSLPASRVTAAAPRARQHIAMAEPRGRLIRGRGGVRLYVRHVAVHGRPVHHAVAHGSSHTRALHIAKARTEHVVGRHAAHIASRGHVGGRSPHTVSRATRAAVVHHRGRG